MTDWIKPTLGALAFGAMLNAAILLDPRREHSILTAAVFIGVATVMVGYTRVNKDLGWSAKAGIYIYALFCGIFGFIVTVSA